MRTLLTQTTADHTLRIPYEEVLLAGGSEASVKFSDEFGGGYMAYMELPHHMHCLYELWRHTYPTYSNSFALGLEVQNSSFRQHLDHCADMLRQVLLCNSDPGLISYNWVKHLSHPTPNFNTPHQCRNASALYEWMDEHKVEASLEGLKKPSDAIELETFP